MNYEHVDELIVPIQEYAKTLKESDRVRLAAYLTTLVDSVQQDKAVPMNMPEFHRVDGLCYDIHNQLENLSDDFYDIADLMDKSA